MKRKWLTAAAAALLCLTMVTGACGSARDASSGAESGAADTSAGAGAESSGEAADPGSAPEEGGEDASHDGPEDAPMTDETADFENIETFLAVGNYKDFQLVRDSDPYEEDDHDDSDLIDSILDLYYRYPEGTPIEYGMTARIDYVGRVGGETFEGGTGSYDLGIGSGAFIPGFEDQLVGHTAGETVLVDLTFPDDYHEKLAGKDVEFTVTINELIADPWTVVVGNSRVLRYPSALVEMWKQQILSGYERSAAQYGMTLEEYRTAAGITDESVETAAKSSVKQYLTAVAVLAEEGITKDSSEWKEMDQAIMENSGYANRGEVMAAGISEEQIDITTAYYAAYKVMADYAVIEEN